MPNCNALKADFQRCNVFVTEEGSMCGTHTNTHTRRIQRSGPRPTGTCEAYLSTHRWCGETHLPNERLCARHNVIHQRGIVEAQEALADRRMLATFINHQPQFQWQVVMDAVVDDTTRTPMRCYQIAVRYFIQTNPGMGLETFHARWNWAIAGRNGPEPLEIPPLQEPVAPPAPRARDQHLGVLANDRQNVHTAPVTKQTNAGLEKILKVDIPKSQDTQATITKEWLFNPIEQKRPKFNTYLEVINDINKWFNTKTCRERNDRLYFNVLRGVVAIINKTSSETRSELYQRLWEECLESVDMCCDGHITRLCNVFVGFDDEFKPPIPFGEILQNKMSAIASSDVDEEEKRKQANAFFDEYAVPQEERIAWLEAF